MKLILEQEKSVYYNPRCYGCKNHRTLCCCPNGFEVAETERGMCSLAIGTVMKKCIDCGLEKPWSHFGTVSTKNFCNSCCYLRRTKSA